VEKLPKRATWMQKVSTTKTPNKQAVRQKYPGKRTKNRETVFGVQPVTAPPWLFRILKINFSQKNLLIHSQRKFKRLCLKLKLKSAVRCPLLLHLYKSGRNGKSSCPKDVATLNADDYSSVV
jgi:hypothetical protein